jgi:hypothetical protein
MTDRATVGWYAVAFVPFFLGTLGLFQARAQTCVFLAAVGKRNMDGGAEEIADRALLAQDRLRAVRVWLRAAGVALVLTLLACALAIAY